MLIQANLIPGVTIPYPNSLVVRSRYDMTSQYSAAIVHGGKVIQVSVMIGRGLKLVLYNTVLCPDPYLVT